MIRHSRRQVIGLIGFPLKHSISPAFQQAAFDYHSLPVVYEAWEVPIERLGQVLTRVRQPDCLGANVTIPHKEAVLPQLNATAPLARQIGAANTIVNASGRLIGHNTDVEGFLRALRENAHYEPAGKRVVMLGAGGAARAVVFGLLEAGVTSISIANRTLDRAQALVDVVRKSFADPPVEVIPWLQNVEETGQPGSITDLMRTRLSECQLLVNTTSIGTRHGLERSPLPAECIPSQGLVYDLVYNPPQTRLLQLAERVGAQTLNGLPMLVYQGAAAFELWTGQIAPIGLMMRRAEEALQGW